MVNFKELRMAVELLSECCVISPVAHAETQFNINEMEKEMIWIVDDGEGENNV